MSHRKMLLVVLILSTFCLGQEPTAQQLLDRWAGALGGREKLRAITATHEKSSFEVGGLKGSSETWQSVAGQSRDDTQIAGMMHEVTVFDGQQGWIRSSQGTVRSVQGPDLEMQYNSAYFGTDSQFFPDRRPGKVEFAGGDTTGKCWILAITPEHGRTVKVYLDKQTGLPVRQEMALADRTITTYFDEWREIHGIKRVARGRQSTGESKYDAAFVLESFEANPKLAADLFTKPSSGGPAFEFAQDAHSATFPIELASNHIYIQVSVNGSKPRWMIFDTGAEASVLNADYLPQLGLKAEGALQGSGAGEKSVDVGLVKQAVISFPGLKLSPRSIAAISLGSLEPREGRQVAGILGYDVISSFVVEIDYAGRKLTLYDPANYKYAGKGAAIPFVFQGNMPMIQATLALPGRDPIQGKFLVDTGARMELSVNGPFDQANKISAGLKTVNAGIGYGVGGETKEVQGRIDVLRIGDFSLKAPVASFSLDTKGAGASVDDNGLVGAEVWRRFTVTFDYAAQKMYLEPNAALNEPFEFDATGIKVEALGSDYRKFHVFRVIADSPASAAGVKEGDVILGVNGKLPANLDELLRLFKRDGQTYTIDLDRDGRKVSVTLRTKSLV